MSMLEQFAEVVIEEEREEKPAYEPEEYIPVWRKSVGNIIISLERLKATPAIYLRVFYGGSPIFEYGPFFSRKSFNLGRKDWEDLAAELEKRGERPLAVLKPSDWEQLIKEVYNKVPESPILPPVIEVGDPIPVSIEDLARHGDKYLLDPVEFSGVIVGRSEIKTIPVAVKKVLKKGKEVVIPFDIRNPQEAIKFVTYAGERLDEARFFILQLQQHMGHDKFIVYAVGCEVPRSKMVRVRGVVVSEGRRPPFRLVVLATEVDPLNEVVERLEVTPELLKIAGFQAKDYDELKQLIDAAFAPKILGRGFAKLAYALSLFSIENICIGEEVMDGILRTLYFGDTKTGKSSIAKWVYERLGLGAYTVAETGSRAGLLYTVDTETRTVIWGAVTLADREYAVIDGFDKMHPEEWKEFREAVENRKVVVRKKAQADAPFRVRLVFCANAEHPISSYIHPIEALHDIHTLSGRDAGASVTRIDFFIPFSAEDVPPERIVEAVMKTTSFDLNQMRLKLLLAWKVEKAIFTPEAVRQLQTIALKLIGRYGSMKPPVIHNGYFRTVAKVAAAFASLLGRYQLTREGLEVRVTEEVIPFVERFFEEYLTVLGVPGHVASSQADIIELAEKVEKEGLLAEALRLIYQRKQQGIPISKSELGAALNVRDHNKQQQLINKLAELKLIIAKPRVGLILTPEGRRVAAHLMRKEESAPLRGRGVKNLSLAQLVLSETDYLKVREESPRETTQGTSSEAEPSNNLAEPSFKNELPSTPLFTTVSETEPNLESEPSNNLAEPSSENKPQQEAPCGSKPEQFNNLSHTRLITQDSEYLPQGGKREPFSKFEPSSFASCYLKLSQRLKEEPEGLSVEELVKYGVELGFSEKLVRAVLQFMKDRGKVALRKEGWLVWS